MRRGLDNIDEGNMPNTLRDYTFQCDFTHFRDGRDEASGEVEHPQNLAAGPWTPAERQIILTAVYQVAAFLFEQCVG